MKSQCVRSKESGRRPLIRNRRPTVANRKTAPLEARQRQITGRGGLNLPSPWSRPSLGFDQSGRDAEAARILERASTHIAGVDNGREHAGRAPTDMEAGGCAGRAPELLTLRCCSTWRRLSPSREADHGSRGRACKDVQKMMSESCKSLQTPLERLPPDARARNQAREKGVNTDGPGATIRARQNAPGPLRGELQRRYPYSGHRDRSASAIARDLDSSGRPAGRPVGSIPRPKIPALERTPRTHVAAQTPSHIAAVDRGPARRTTASG